MFQRHKRAISPYLWLIAVFLFMQSCSTRLPPAGVKAYDECHYDQAIDIFSHAPKKDKDLLLYDLAILSSAVHKGDEEEVKKAGNRAQQQMWNYEGKGAGTASLVSSEALRYYKGEPFEKSMASLYLGIVYFNEQDYENAKAAFTKAVFSVQTKGDDAVADFAAPYILLAKTFLKLNDEDNARITLSRLEKAIPGRGLTLDTLRKVRTIGFIEIGVGPKKIRTGPGGSLVQWQRQSYYDRHAQLLIDGKPMSVAYQFADDLTYQAQSTDRGGKTAIQATKGGLREAAGVTSVIAADQALATHNATAGWIALGAGLFALADQSQADVRQWQMLPDRIQLELSDEPRTTGRHEYVADFSGRFENDLPSARQVWYDERTPDQDKIYVIRARTCGVVEVYPERQRRQRVRVFIR